MCSRRYLPGSELTWFFAILPYHLFGADLPRDLAFLLELCGTPFVIVVGCRLSVFSNRHPGSHLRFACLLPSSFVSVMLLADDPNVPITYSDCNCCPQHYTLGYNHNISRTRPLLRGPHVACSPFPLFNRGYGLSHFY